MNPAIFFHPDAIESKDTELVGRRSAGQSFARAFLENKQAKQVNVVTDTKAHAEAFVQFARGAGEDRNIEAAIMRARQDFTKFGTVFFPTPGYGTGAWQRARGDMRRCSLVGITHTVSTRRIVESLHELMSQPVHPWDAIICTSRAVQSVVKRQFEMEAYYFRERFGASQVPQPHLPLIPLGIHAADFAPRDEGRAKIRARFNTPDNAVVVMTMGRLTSVEKANPVPLFMALERIAAKGCPVHLWMTGWSSRNEEQTLHEAGARALCPNVTVQFVDGREADVRRDIWSGADVFTLPVDNIQETFGLVPVEAMAAGLPVVMPDWNGFRDTIVDGVTGFLIPTMTPPPDDPVGPLLAARFADGADGYLPYLSTIQQQTMIDMGAYTGALEQLINDADLRKRMGEAGRKHIAQTFDWSVVMPQYFNLADELALLRARAKTVAAVPNPMEGSPFDLYQQYPTQHITAGTVVRFVRSLDVEGLVALDALNGRTLYNRRIAPDEQIINVLDIIAQEGPIKIADLKGLAAKWEDRIVGIVLFLAKYDFVTLGPQVSK